MVSSLHATGGGRLTHAVCVDGAGDVIMPCGRCRQLLFENGGPDLLLMTGLRACAGWTRCCRMPSAPTTSLDLTAAEVVADPYPFFAAERARHAVAWHEPSQLYLTFDPRDGRRRAAHPRPRAAVDRTGSRADELEPFNLLHRNQMMENEPPEHTRLRRPVASRVRPRPRRAAAARGCASSRPALLDEVDPARLRRRRGVRRAAAGAGDRRAARRTRRRTRRRCATGRRRSCGCTSRRPGRTWSAAAVAAATRLRRAGARADRASGGSVPARRPDQRPGGHRPDRGRAWSRPSCCCSTPATRPRSTSSATGWPRCCAAGCVPGADVAP